MSILMARRAWSWLLGKAYGANRDYYEVYGYPHIVRFEDYYNVYSRQDIAKRVVSAPAAAVWRTPPEIKSDSETFVTEFNRVVEEVEFWNAAERADKLCAMGQFSVLLLGFNDGGNLESPVRSTPTTKLIYVQPYAESSVDIPEFDADPSSPRYGKPLKYKLKLIDPTNLMVTTGAGGNVTPVTGKVKELEVHWTRVIHVVEDRLESDLIGIPRLQNVYNILQDMLKTVGGSAEVYWLQARGGLHVDVDKEVDLGTEDAAALSAEIDEFVHQLRRVIRTKGVEINALDQKIHDPSNIFKVQISLLSAATGIPQRILTGAEAGQLASEQDRANWAERTDERRKSFAEPVIIKPFIQRMNQAQVLPDNEYTLEWPEAFKMNPIEEGQAAANMGRAALSFARQDEHTTPITSRTEARKFMNLPAEMDSEDEEIEPNPNDVPDEGDGDDTDTDETAETGDEDASDTDTPEEEESQASVVTAFKG